MYKLNAKKTAQDDKDKSVGTVLKLYITLSTI